MTDRLRASIVVRRSTGLRVFAVVLALTAAAAAALLAAAGFFDRDALHIFPAIGRRSQVGAVYLSGDMGLRFGMSPATAAALTRSGIAVVGVSTSTVFAIRRSRDDVDRLVADAVRQGLARTRAGRVVVIGQSYGADILQTGLATLPANLRGRIAAVVLVVPGTTVFFRADPSGLAYRGTPDGLGRDTARTIDWAPLTCIYGLAETDSLCPELDRPNQHVVAMPGGHFLDRDDDALTDQILGAIDRAVPGATGRPRSNAAT